MTKSYNASIPKLVDNILLNLEEHKEVVKYVSKAPINSDKSTKKVDTKKKKPDYVYKKYYTYNNSEIKLDREDIVTFVMCLKEVLDKESPKIKYIYRAIDHLNIIRNANIKKLHSDKCNLEYNA